MQLIVIYETLKKHLCSQYSIDVESHDALRLTLRVNCRAIILAYLHETIRLYRREHGTFIGISCREAIIHMLYEDAGLRISDLNQIPLSLALKILNPRLSRIDTSVDRNFYNMAQEMTQWSEGDRESLSLSHEADLELPELQWSDLPGELFSLSSGK
ncbi:hypothetical protein [Serratia fonticola]|uniref:hypothetical protein n=1 Tax=Serratia fonticola TaxID=47917 RepID=UPI00301D8F7A